MDEFLASESDAPLKNMDSPKPRAKKLVTLFAHLDKSVKPKQVGWAAKKPARKASSATAGALDVFGACESGQLNLLKEVLSAGQPVDALDAQKRTPLHYAVAGAGFASYACLRRVD